MTDAVILIPGIMGSVLQDGDEVVWPGDPLELVLPYKHMNALLKPDLIASDVIRRVSISSQYDHLIKSLNACGFAEGNHETLKVFPYDWRKDNSLAAAALANCIDDLAASEPDFEITLLAHSMGGLIGRCYLESGLYNTRLGFSRVKCLITMGTPHRGAPMALAAALGQEKRLFLNAKQVQTVANDPNFPSLYQLLPPKSEPFAWDRAMDARLEPEDIYDPQIANELGLSVVNLESASRFHKLLDLTKRPPHVRYFFFAGTRQPTTHSVQVSRNGTKRTIAKIDHYDAGDGTVPFWSGSQSGVQTEPVGGEHGDLYKNGGLKTVLGALLGKTGVMLAPGAVPEISIRKKVVNPEEPLQVTIDFPNATTTVQGEVRLRRVVNAAGVFVPTAPWSERFPISYSGPQLDHLMVIFDAPQNIGVYELSYFPTGSVSSAATAELFVQEL